MSKPEWCDCRKDDRYENAYIACRIHGIQMLTGFWHNYGQVDSVHADCCDAPALTADIAQFGEEDVRLALSLLEDDADRIYGQRLLKMALEQE